MVVVVRAGGNESRVFRCTHVHIGANGYSFENVVPPPAKYGVPELGWPAYSMHVPFQDVSAVQYYRESAAES